MSLLKRHPLSSSHIGVQRGHRPTALRADVPARGAGWDLGIEKGKPRRVWNAAPVVDDIGNVDEHPGGVLEVGDMGEGLDTLDRTAGEVVSARGRTVTLRDFMMFYIFTRRGTSPWFLL